MEIETLNIYLNLLLIWMQIIRLRLCVRKRKKGIIRRWWVKPHITRNMRQNFGAHHTLFIYFQMNNHEEFFKLTRMSVEQFDNLNRLLKPKLKKRSRREPLPTEIRIAVTLRLV
ncbi:hypothetical protein ALC57_08348 [Trachymyrmex cornetzi]|uniref:Uncharacterized protein n=1 Tax=Trachymyrmex cornetzi TaxID=471704 RepID=A0A151J6Z6_9HYME|nr:hypothetical protein ALC57_08348 [Trachymyrmex cornetzi]